MPCHDTLLCRWSWPGTGGRRDLSSNYAISLCTKDAFVLGRLLAHPLITLDNVSAALKVYQDVRLPFAQFVARESAHTGRLLNFDMSSVAREDVQKELEIQREKMVAQWEWESKDSPINEWLEAERKLQESLGVSNGL